MKFSRERKRWRQWGEGEAGWCPTIFPLRHQIPSPWTLHTEGWPHPLISQRPHPPSCRREEREWWKESQRRSCPILTGEKESLRGRLEFSGNTCWVTTERGGDRRKNKVNKGNGKHVATPINWCGVTIPPQRLSSNQQNSRQSWERRSLAACYPLSSDGPHREWAGTLGSRGRTWHEPEWWCNDHFRPLKINQSDDVMIIKMNQSDDVMIISDHWKWTRVMM